MDDKKRLNVLNVLISNTMGGAEKEYMNLFNYLSLHGKHSYSFVMNKEIYLKLKQAKLIESEEKIIVVGWDIGGRLKLYGLKSLNAWKEPKRWLLNICQLFKKFIYMVLSFFNNKLTAWRIRKLFKDIKPDIAHGILRGTQTLFLPEARNFAKVSSYVSANDIPEYLRQISPQLDALDVLSPSMGKRLLTENVIDKNKVYVAPCCFINYEKMYVKTKKRIVVFMARIERVKHPEIFVEMVKYISPQNLVNTKFLMLGTGSRESQIFKMARPLIQQGVFDFTGYVPKPYDYLAESLIFVQPTDCEDHATQSLLEAMACGNVPVSTYFPGMEEIISPDIGFLVPLHAQAFAEKVDFLLSHEKLAQEMGQKAREKVVHTQTIERYAEHMDRVYEAAYFAKYLK